MEKEVITIVAFQDGQVNSMSYKKFDDIKKAANFYRKLLEKEFVKTISTRKCRVRIK